MSEHGRDGDNSRRRNRPPRPGDSARGPSRSGGLRGKPSRPGRDASLGSPPRPGRDASLGKPPRPNGPRRQGRDDNGRDNYGRDNRSGARGGWRAEPRDRRSLSHQGGVTEKTGDPELVAKLAQALEAPDTTPDGPELTHGFHTYPARMHPSIARKVIELLAPPQGIVVDPFCGSGTVLVEAAVAGRQGLGVDLNPLSRRVADVHCNPWDAAGREGLKALCTELAEASEDRVRGRVKVRAPLPAEEVARYSPHILLELAGLHAEILAIPNEASRRVLETVFSALVVKFSNQRADTTEQTQERRLRKGLVTEFYVRKVDELLARWAELESLLPANTPPVRLMEGDARQLHKVLRKGTKVDLVLTSPPYGGTYDYVEHHARRYPWMGISPVRFAEGEIGARRNLREEQDIAQWDHELFESLAAMARVGRPGAFVVLLLGDAQLGETRIDAAAQVAALSRRAGLEMLASAAQYRPDFQGGEPRREHLIGLRVPGDRPRVPVK